MGKRIEAQSQCEVAQAPVAIRVRPDGGRWGFFIRSTPAIDAATAIPPADPSAARRSPKSLHAQYRGGDPDWASSIDLSGPHGDSVDWHRFRRATQLANIRGTNTQCRLDVDTSSFAQTAVIRCSRQWLNSTLRKRDRLCNVRAAKFVWMNVGQSATTRLRGGTLRRVSGNATRRIERDLPKNRPETPSGAGHAADLDRPLATRHFPPIWEERGAPGSA
jgi:hypothetical protein